VRARLRSLALIALIGFALAGCSRQASPPPVAPATPAMSMPMAPSTLSPQPNAAERKFLAMVGPDILSRFPDETAASAGGYLRYTDEDQDGIISFTDLQWFADDPRHPTQLWYDAHGRVIGADYTMPVTDRTKRPNIWGLQPGRWVHFIAHMHYVVKEPDGTTRYGSLLNPTYRANGGDPAHPSAQPLVRLGIAKRASDVAAIFQLPEIWIASMWLVPNPKGAFADSNPLVKPTAHVHRPAHPM
jgi:hypothetical protein